MYVQCDKCNRWNDDTARWTICPHSPLGHPTDDLCPKCDTLRSRHGPCQHQQPKKETILIKPTVGRVVWFYKYNSVTGHQGPLAAHICKVWGDRLVNLMVIGEEGVPYAETSVLLLQDDAPAGMPPPQGNYCCWMPYQQGQAAKAEALEKQLAPK
jgi:hypothetical protein